MFCRIFFGLSARKPALAILVLTLATTTAKSQGNAVRGNAVAAATADNALARATAARAR